MSELEALSDGIRCVERAIDATTAELITAQLAIVGAIDRLTKQVAELADTVGAD